MECNVFVIELGGKQYTVQIGEEICIDLNKSNLAIGDSVFANCLISMEKDQGLCRHMDIADSQNKKSVELKLLAHAAGPKVIAYKYKRRKGFHKTIGHRQAYFVAKICGLRG